MSDPSAPLANAAETVDEIIGEGADKVDQFAASGGGWFGWGALGSLLGAGATKVGLKKVGRLLSRKKGYSATDFPDIADKISQTQLRHIKGHKDYRGGGFLDRLADAQTVLDEFKSGNAKILGVNKNGFPVVSYSGVTGTNNNVGAGYINQPTNVFVVKGTKRPSIVPTNPNWSE